MVRIIKKSLSEVVTVIYDVPLRGYSFYLFQTGLFVGKTFALHIVIIFGITVLRLIFRRTWYILIGNCLLLPVRAGSCCRITDSLKKFPQLCSRNFSILCLIRLYIQIRKCFGKDSLCNVLCVRTACLIIYLRLIHNYIDLAIVPVGSGNGLARHLGISMDVRKALEIINDGQIVDLDYCTANDRPFFCTCGVGFDALVSLKFAQGKRRGKLSYVAKALTEYLKYKSETYQIEMPDGTVTEKAFLIACGNASQYGNNAYIAPHASMQDGKIDVTVLMPFTPFDTAALALLLFTKHIDQDSNIKSFTTESLTIKREKPGAIHLDGEPIEMGTRIDVRCFKGGLHALIPSGEPKRSIIEPFASVFWEFIETVRQELNI